MCAGDESSGNQIRVKCEKHQSTRTPIREKSTQYFLAIKSSPHKIKTSQSRLLHQLMSASTLLQMGLTLNFWIEVVESTASKVSIYSTEDNPLSIRDVITLSECERVKKVLLSTRKTAAVLFYPWMCKRFLVICFRSFCSASTPTVLDRIRFQYQSSPDSRSKYVKKLSLALVNVQLVQNSPGTL